MSDKISSVSKVMMFDFDPGATTVTAVSWQPMENFQNLLAMFMRTIGTSTATLTINAATDSSGTDSAVVATKTFTDGQPDAVGDYVYLEVSAEDVAQKASDNSKNYTHVSAVISVETGTDEAVVTYVFTGSRYTNGNGTEDHVTT
jgi:hypothetical protein